MERHESDPRALGEIGEGAVPALIQALKDQDAEVRRNAAVALVYIGTPEALKAVEEYQSRQ
ncbi:TPA: HEAT repeat domain-containing protein [Candidatus Poribacteria bacterium]|nr:HEAT repeat domain-containing protein [Candidatus Poribacteria bacterium]HIA65330.1 HEAT repeat domain-containing protein [Candidatus Poribacteria bacterium]HIB86960.1 HEAT repeat domain-containing protein [Candidatus Poribacteria bacterium]HIB98515.1 HEAT repeat domain-containing protein [Candidatus Poribacteria bacterium]HIO39770.1 HEAT repeat domain-containing protein [Rhodospirillales bacterium]